MSTSVCPRCKSAFSCGVALQNCWCSEVELSEETRAALRVSYEKCLCPDCLASLSAADKIQDVSADP